MRNGTNAESDVIVIGGGLAGLTAAAYAGRGGRSVTVLEQSRHAGGRAMTSRRNGFDFNRGAHALYRAGAGRKALDELGVRYTGKAPPLSGHGELAGELHRMSLTPWWLARTQLLPGLAKLDVARFLAMLPATDPQKLAKVTAAAWLGEKVPRAAARLQIEALLRVATYTNAPDSLSAEVGASQLKLALRGVLYVDGGWQTIVDGLQRAAETAGARVVTGAKAVAIERDGSVRGVRLADGTLLAARAVIVASTPEAAAELTGEASLRDLPPRVRVACLDVGLSRLPNPQVRFAMGLDAPTYFSVHSESARLAPEGGALIHTAKYLAPDDARDAKETERELEAVLDLAQPGWREVLQERQYLPDINVVGAQATAERGGYAGRTPVEVAGTRGLFLAGDWVGPEGWLSDASYASAKSAAELALRSLSGADGISRSEPIMARS